MEHFKELTKEEHEVFEQIAVNCDQMHDEAVLLRLLDKGFITAHAGVLRTAGQYPVNIINYSVPIGLHMEWCSWCAECEDSQ